MLCQNCHQDIKTKGFRLSFRLKCKHCGAQYNVHQKCLNPKQATVWNIGFFAFVLLNTFMAQYVNSHYGMGFAVLSSTSVMLLFFFGSRRFKPLYETCYWPVIPIDPAIVREDSKALILSIVLAGMVTAVVMAFV